MYSDKRTTQEVVTSIKVIGNAIGFAIMAILVGGLFYVVDALFT